MIENIVGVLLLIPVCILRLYNYYHDKKFERSIKKRSRIHIR